MINEGCVTMEVSQYIRLLELEVRQSPEMAALRIVGLMEENERLRNELSALEENQQ